MTLQTALDPVKRADEAVDLAAALRALRLVERSTRGMVELLDDLLDVARVERGEVALRPRRLDLAELLAALVASFAPEAEASDVALSFEAGSAGPACVEGDRLRLEPAFGNLLVNALKFTPARGSVGVYLEPEGGRARVRLRDTGPGIAPELLPHVFEQRQPGEGAAPGERRGLGLALVRHVAALHGGSVAAESEGEGEGQGATFTVRTVRLPLAPPSNDAGREST